MVRLDDDFDEALPGDGEECRDCTFESETFHILRETSGFLSKPLPWDHESGDSEGECG